MKEKEPVSATTPMTAERSQWIRRMLPFMVGSLVFMGLFFFVASLVQLYNLQSEIRHEAFDVYEKMGAQKDSKSGNRDAFEASKWNTLVLLEQNLIKRRYHQANSIMLTRVWTRYLGFMTGMIMALVGAVFILGRLGEMPTRIEGEGSGLKATLETSSPGITLAFLGTVLMIATLVVKFEVSIKDVPVYLKTAGQTRQLPPPKVLPEPGNPTTPPKCDPNSPFPEDRAGCP